MPGGNINEITAVPPTSAKGRLKGDPKGRTALYPLFFSSSDGNLEHTSRQDRIGAPRESATQTLHAVSPQQNTKNNPTLTLIRSQIRQKQRSFLPGKRAVLDQHPWPKQHPGLVRVYLCFASSVSILFVALRRRTRCTIVFAVAAFQANYQIAITTMS